MNRDQIIKMLREVREVIAWNDISGWALNSEAREKICIDLDDAIEQIMEGADDEN